jgi:galactokinase
MMGGGFGGSVIALADRASAEAAQRTIVAAYSLKLGRPAESFVVQLAQGGHEMAELVA